MNVLLTSAGRRSYLVEYFRQSQMKFRGGQVFAANCYADTAAMYLADKAFVVPPSHSPEYVSFLLDLCLQHDIGMICSLHDMDVFILSKHKPEFARNNVELVVPSEEWGLTCLDKFKCHQVLQANGFDVPWASNCRSETLLAFDSEVIRYPIMLKDRYGYGSGNLGKCNSPREFELLDPLVRDRVSSSESIQFLPEVDAAESIMYQQAIMGEEYCVDIVNDLQGNYKTHLACKVHAMRAGETDNVTVVAPDLFGDIAVRLSRLIGHPGILGMDLMYDGGTFWIIDINPRFTGDYPFHHIAGADVPSALPAWAQGSPIDPEWLSSTPGVRGFKALVPTAIER